MAKFDLAPEVAVRSLPMSARGGVADPERINALATDIPAAINTLNGPF